MTIMPYTNLSAVAVWPLPRCNEEFTGSIPSYWDFDYMKAMTMIDSVCTSRRIAHVYAHKA